MSSDEQDMMQNSSSMGGKMKKSNGHKMSCMCPICKNMMKKGGSPETDEAQLDTSTSPMLGGRRRKTRKTRKIRRSRRHRKGGKQTRRYKKGGRR